MKKVLIVTAISCLMIGCKPYDVPEYAEIKPHESAFAIPMEGDVGSQTSFESEEFLRQNMIAAKRIQIPHRFNKTGRMYFAGEWIDTLRVIVVDRSPVNRYWTDKNGIQVETNDSVGLSMDITCTAMITQGNTPLFLYRYPAGSLATVMDQEIRAKVQTELTKEVAKYSLEEVKLDKGKIMEPVRKTVTDFFSTRGIEITVLGFGGGLQYNNDLIQQAIDKVVQDQQLAQSAEAKYQAQLKFNETIKAEAEAMAEAARTKARGEADAIKSLADAKAYEIDQMKKDTPSYITLRELENQKIAFDRWTGILPTTVFGGSQGIPGMFLNMPMPTNKQ